MPHTRLNRFNFAADGIVPYLLLIPMYQQLATSLPPAADKYNEDFDLVRQGNMIVRN
jgi:hypothetical protein